MLMFLKDIPTFVCLNKLVIFLIFGLWDAKVDHVLFLFLSLVCSWFFFFFVLYLMV